MSFPTSGCASWYEVMSETRHTVLPVPVGISSRQWPCLFVRLFVKSIE